MKRVAINIFGKVQMVGFRYRVIKKARELNLTGLVDDLRDGSVGIEAQGEPSQIKKLVEWCKTGPPYANVVKVIIEDMEVEVDEKDFEML